MKNFIAVIIRSFFGGTLFLVPVIATVYFIIWAFQRLDNLIELPYPGLGFVIIFSAITLFGYFSTNFAFQTFATWINQWMDKIPLVKLIYSPLKDLLEAFVGEKRKFEKPVLVQLDKNQALYKIGFITKNDLNELGLHEMVSVYLPQSYTFAGDHFIVPHSQIKPLNISGTQAMKFIISGGVSGFEK